MLVVAAFRGMVSDADFVDLYDRLYHAEEYGLGMDEIADLRRVELFDVSTEALRTVDHLVRRVYEGSTRSFRTAVIAPSDLAFGIARIYEAFAADGPEQMLVTRSASEAAEWLGVEESLLGTDE